MDQIRPKHRSRRGWPRIHRIGRCQCGYPVFFRNHLCLHCGRALGYAPDSLSILSLEPADQQGHWRPAGAVAHRVLYLRCSNFDVAAQCNWLLLHTDTEQHDLCKCCRLNRTVPDQSIPANGVLWHKVELAKRRLVSSLIALGLPVESRIGENPEQGMAFDLLADVPPQSVRTGHANGIITINVGEGDDATREAIRSTLQEPYRTLLGHVRHESGHYYWERLLENTRWHEPFRQLFGDEREDYAAALKAHYDEGPNLAWANTCVSAYASAHPWEDWAETWAHYLHMVDTLDIAMDSGIHGDHLDLLLKDPFDADVLYRFENEEEQPDDEFLNFFNSWTGLTSVLNEFSLGMGLQDFYPFVLSNPCITKLHFVHRFIKDYRLSSTAQPPGGMK